MPAVPVTLSEALARIADLEQATKLAQAVADAATRQRDTVLSNLREGLLLIDDTGLVVLLNDEYCRQLGLTLPATQWLGLSAFALSEMVKSQFADPEKFVNDLQQDRQLQTPQLSAELPMADDRVLSRDVLPVKTGSGTSFLVSYRDVTANFHARQALRMLAHLPDQNPSPILRIDAAGKQLYANTTAQLLQSQLLPDAYAALITGLQTVIQQTLRTHQQQQTVVQAGPMWFQVEILPLVAEGYANCYLIDITARYKAKEELAAQRTFYETILNNLPVEVSVVDANYRYQYLNPQAVPNPAHRLMAVGQTIAEHGRALGRPAALTAQRQARFEQTRSGEPFEWTEKSEGSNWQRDYLRRIQPFFDAENNLLWFIAYGLDVTDAEDAHRALAVQQTFTQQVLDATPSLIFVRNQDGKFLLQNRAFQFLSKGSLTYTPTPGSVQAEEAAQWAAVDFQVLAEDAELMSEDRLTMPDGAVKWYQTVKRPLHLPDGTVHVLGVSTDITALKQAQQTLERSEKQYRDLMHYSQALIGTCDMLGTVLTVNPALATLLGENAADIPGHHVTDYLPTMNRHFFDLYLEHMATDGEEKGVLKVQPRGSTEIRYLLYHNVIVREPNAPYIISHGLDITDRILAEEEMKRAQLAAEASATARQNFLANMSHEIRTPMHGVLGIAAQLAKTCLDPHQQQLVGIMQRSGDHLLAMLNDVLDMAKISSGKLEMEQLTFNLSETMGQALQPLALQAAEKGLLFEQVLFGETNSSHWVVGDPHRLNQIIINLVSNALKFTKAGSVTFSSELVSESAEAIEVCFRVTDTGIGIAEAQQARIFESFIQAYAGTNHQYSGTGLGLSIALALVKQFSGTLTLDSTLDQGSTFTFTLPLLRAAAQTVGHVSATDTNTGRLAGTRVLLVEDNEINRTLVRMMLESWNMVLDEAVDGAAGLACLEAHRYDVVLMDIQMPGLNGVAVTQRLRQLPNQEQACTPVIALTANVFRTDIEYYLAAGMNDFLAKPFHEAALYAKLVAVLDAATTPLYDLTYLRQQAQGRVAFVHQILRSFLTNMPASLVCLQAASAAQRWPEAAEVAHHIQPNLFALAVSGVAPALAVLSKAHPRASGPAPAPKTLLAAAEALIAVTNRVLAALPTELSEV